MTGQSAKRRFSAATMRLVGSITQRANAGSGRIPAQLSNSCTTSAPASIWPVEILDRGFHKQVDQRVETLGVAIRPALDPAEIPASAAFDHVGRNRPGRTGKTDQRRPRIQRRL